MEQIKIHTKGLNRIAPGMVFIKGAFDQDAQIYLAKCAMQAGADEKRGFWETKPDGSKILNSRAGRGRIYDAINNFQDADLIVKLCKDLVAEAMKFDSMMPDINPTHLLLLYYATERGIGWHADDGANDGDNDHPVVSITIGNSCSFGYQIHGKKYAITLESGDVIIWGGPLRMMKHNVDKVNRKTCPAWLPLDDVRLNFTYRDAPSIVGKEEQFKYYVSNTYKNQQPDLAKKTVGKMGKFP